MGSIHCALEIIIYKPTAPQLCLLVIDACCSTLFYSRLCPSTAGSSPPPESPIFLCPLLSLSIPLPVVPQCQLSNDRCLLCQTNRVTCLLFHFLALCQCKFIPAVRSNGKLCNDYITIFIECTSKC